jgi:hypothetical protein
MSRSVSGAGEWIMRSTGTTADRGLKSQPEV